MNIYQHTYVLCRRRQITRVPSYCVIFNWFDVKARGGQISCHNIYREYLYYFLEMELPIRMYVMHKFHRSMLYILEASSYLIL
jgi:hypothetical protein